MSPAPTGTERQRLRTPVRCGSCKRAFGWSERPGALRNAIFCSEWCADEPPVDLKPERNDQWLLLALAGGRTALEIARLYDVPHPAVYKALGRLMP